MDVRKILPWVGSWGFRSFPLEPQREQLPREPSLPSSQRLPGPSGKSPTQRQGRDAALKPGTPKTGSGAEPARYSPWLPCLAEPLSDVPVHQCFCCKVFLAWRWDSTLWFSCANTVLLALFKIHPMWNWMGRKNVLKVPLLFWVLMFCCMPLLRRLSRCFSVRFFHT